MHMRGCAVVAVEEGHMCCTVAGSDILCVLGSRNSGGRSSKVVLSIGTNMCCGYDHGRDHCRDYGRGHGCDYGHGRERGCFRRYCYSGRGCWLMIVEWK